MLAERSEIDAGQFGRHVPQARRHDRVLGPFGGPDPLGVAALLTEPVGSVVLAALDVGVGGRSQRGQGTLIQVGLPAMGTA